MSHRYPERYNLHDLLEATMLGRVVAGADAVASVVIEPNRNTEHPQWEMRVVWHDMKWWLSEDDVDHLAKMCARLKELRASKLRQPERRP